MKTKTWETCELCDLKGRPGTTESAWVSSVSDAVAAMRKHDSVTTAGCDGSISAWRDLTSGGIRAEFMRYKVAVDSTVVTSLAGLRMWLREWWPKMGDRDRLAARI